MLATFLAYILFVTNEFSYAVTFRVSTYADGFWSFVCNQVSKTDQQQLSTIQRSAMLRSLLSLSIMTRTNIVIEFRSAFICKHMFATVRSSILFSPAVNPTSYKLCYTCCSPFSQSYISLKHNNNITLLQMHPMTRYLGPIYFLKMAA